MAAEGSDLKGQRATPATMAAQSLSTPKMAHVDLGYATSLDVTVASFLEDDGGVAADAEDVDSGLVEEL